MLEVAGGSSEAFVELVRRYQDQLLNFFARMGANMDGEDLVQETFLRIYRSRARYQPTARFKTFLYVVARHVWADHCRRVVRTERVANWLQMDAAINAGAPGVLQPGQTEDVQDLLNQLSPKLREVIVLNLYQGLRYREIAEVLGIPLGTVKSRINLALNTLRSYLNGNGEKT